MLGARQIRRKVRLNISQQFIGGRRYPDILDTLVVLRSAPPSSLTHRCRGEVHRSPALLGRRTP